MIAALALPAVMGGCEDIRQFSGSWQGPVSPDPAQQQGFAANSVMQATVGGVSRGHIDLLVQLPGMTDALPFQSIRGAAGDALGDMRLEGDPFRSYFGYVQKPGEPPLLTVVSLFADSHIDVRLIRGPDETYGVFSLGRARP